MVFHEQPSLPWTRGDFKLLEAYEIKQKETCGHCGNPVWLCHSDNSDLLWEVKTQTCYADKAVKEWSENNPKSKDSPYAVPYMLTFVDGKPVQDYENLPTRKDFFEEQANE